MANDDDTPAGFLSRWSRRKAEVREGRAVQDLQPPVPNASVPRQAIAPAVTDTAAIQSPATRTAADATSASEAKPAPTLADTQQLTPESDFTGFMARGVAPDVKNAAMKKLFGDPHFNVMDRLDIYIDDYSQPDPLPLAMLRQMTSAKTLNLFDDAPETSVDTHAGDKPSEAQPKVVAQSAPDKNNPNPEPTTHDHADLRLQPDPTARPEGAEPEPV
jgi:cell division septation protein DedD